MSLTDTVPTCAITLVLMVAAGIVIYVGVSFILMRRHTAPRPLSAVAREALRELLWASVIQTLLPLWYVIGRRMGTLARVPRGVPVVFVHGYSQNRVDFLRIARVLGRKGTGPLYGFNYPWITDVTSNARRLHRFIERSCTEAGTMQVDLVCHSLGGLVAMEMLRASGAARVRRCVTIGTPHAGILWKGPILGACGAQIREGSAFLRELALAPLPVPCLSIYSTHDNLVHPPPTASLVSRGGRDAVIPHLAHLALLFSPDVADEVARFLAEDVAA